MVCALVPWSVLEVNKTGSHWRQDGRESAWRFGIHDERVVQWLDARDVKSEGPRCHSTTKSWLLGRLVLELRKVTPHKSGIVLVRHPNITHTIQTCISTHLPRRGTCNSPSVPVKRMVQAEEGTCVWGGGGGLWRVFVCGLSL